jgi:hypothetical protein
VTRNPGKPVPGLSDSTGHRQKIESIEYIISTTMPGKIGLAWLEQFVEQIIAAIEFLRTSRGQCKDKNSVISYLEEAKIPLQVAIDEFHPGGNNARRYKNISLVCKKLKMALNDW